MKCSSILGLGVIVWLGILTGCSEEPSLTAPVHPQTRIESLVAHPAEVRSGTSSMISAKIVDAGEPVEYFWSANCGSFAGATASPVVTWIAPEEEIQAEITLTLKTPSGIVCSSVQIQTNAFNAPTLLDERVLFPGLNVYVHETKPTPDGGIFAVGEDWTDHSWRGKRWISKLSSDYAVEWSWTSSANDAGAYYGVGVTPEGDYIVAGGEYSVQFHTVDAIVTKFSSSGEILWGRSDWQDYEFWRCIGGSGSGGCLVASGGDEPHLLCLDSEGHRLWYRELDTNKIWKIIEVTGGWILLSGSRRVDNEDNISRISRIIMIDDSGYFLWNRWYGSEDNSTTDSRHIDIESVIETETGDLLAAGTKWGGTHENPSSFFRFMTLLDRNGETLWEKVVGTDHVISAGLTEMKNGQFIAAGLSNHQVSLAGFDQQGLQLWSFKARDGFPFYVHGIHEISEGKILVMGDSHTNGFNQYPAVLLELSF